jgi:glycine cleavage system H protein
MKVFPDDLLYSREHVWVRVEGDLATIGITDYAQEKLGEVLAVELPEIDAEVERDEPFGAVNSDPHDTGWMIVVEMHDLDELDDLLDARGYHDFILQETDGD